MNGNSPPVIATSTFYPSESCTLGKVKPFSVSSVLSLLVKLKCFGIKGSSKVGGMLIGTGGNGLTVNVQTHTESEGTTIDSPADALT